MDWMIWIFDAARGGGGGFDAGGKKEGEEGRRGGKRGSKLTREIGRIGKVDMDAFLQELSCCTPRGLFDHRLYGSVSIGCCTLVHTNTKITTCVLHMVDTRMFHAMSVRITTLDTKQVFCFLVQVMGS